MSGANVDVVVVGAGAAGIGASLALTRLGVSHVVLEAAQRVGGRAFTDTTSLPAPWDQGCQWFHCADVNALAAIAQRIGHGYIVEDYDDRRALWLDNAWQERGVRLAARAAVDAGFERIYGAARDGRDVAMTEVVSFDDRFGRLMRHWLQLMGAGDPDAMSTLGYADYDDTDENWPVKDGYGALIGKMAQGLPVRLGEPVTGISETATGVAVSAAGGVIEARAAIVTVSTNVLLAGAIELPARASADVLCPMSACPCGYYEKVAVAFARDPFGDMDKSYADICDDLPMNFQLAPFGRPLAIGHMAGSHARDLAGAGEDAMVDFALEKLVRGFGSSIRRDVVKTAVTGWTDNPFVRGGYSYSVAGKASDRHAMIAAARSGPVLFAGEAFSPNWQATAHGAYVTGVDAGHAAARFAGVQDTAPDYEWLHA